MVGGFPQAVYADILGLVTGFFLSTVALVPLSDRALMRLAPDLAHNSFGCRPCRRLPDPPRFMMIVIWMVVCLVS